MNFRDALVGIRVSPIIVGQLRGLAVGLVLAMAGAAVVYIGKVDFTVFGLPQGLSVLIGPAALYIYRGLEAAFDQQVTPNQNDTPPATIVKGEKAGGVKVARKKPK